MSQYADLKSDRLWATAIHLSAFSGYVLPFPGMTLLAPLVLWLFKRNDSVYLDDQGREAVNFNLSYILCTLFALLLAAMGMFLLPFAAARQSSVAGSAAMITIGGGIVLVALVLHFLLVVVAAVKANRGERYRYPLTIRIVG